MRLSPIKIALAAAALIAATPANAVTFGIRYYINNTNITGLLIFPHTGLTSAIAAISYLAGSDGRVDNYNDIIVDWPTPTLNSFRINSHYQVTSAHFDAMSADGTEWLRLNANLGEDGAAGHYGDTTSYSISNNAGFNGISFFFNASSSMMSLPMAPEPATWGMMVVGFFAVGTLRYRASRRTRAKSV